MFPGYNFWIAKHISWSQYLLQMPADDTATITPVPHQLQVFTPLTSRAPPRPAERCPSRTASPPGR